MLIYECSYDIHEQRSYVIHALVFVPFSVK